MKFLLSIILVVFLSGCTIASADVGGVDFSMFSGQLPTPNPINYSYYIPKFSDIGWAVVWAHKVKWIEPIRERLEIKMENIAILLIMNQRQRNKKEAALFIKQLQEFNCVKIALSIMEDYKRDGISGDDAAMKSAYAIPPFINVKYAIAYAKAVGNDETIRAAFEHRIWVLRSYAFSKEKNVHFAGLLHASQDIIEEYKILKPALDIMNKARDNAMNGSTVRMSSEPIELHTITVE